MDWWTHHLCPVKDILDLDKEMTIASCTLVPLSSTRNVLEMSILCHFCHRRGTNHLQCGKDNRYHLFITGSVGLNSCTFVEEVKKFIQAHMISVILSFTNWCTIQSLVVTDVMDVLRSCNTSAIIHWMLCYDVG
jgi:hypothetical protein